MRFLWLLAALSAAALPASAQVNETERRPATVVADVVALVQPILYNRFGSHNPHGMIYALRRDVVRSDGAAGPLEPGRVRLRDGKRPRPLVLRANVGDTLEIRFRNLLPAETGPGPCGGRISGDGGAEGGEDWPRTVCAGFSVVGLEMPEPEANGTAVPAGCAPDAPGADTPEARRANDLGRQGLLPQRPGECRVYRFRPERPGAHLILSHAAPAGGEGDGGGLAHGLFGAVVVEREGSRWYRSQVDAPTLADARAAAAPGAFLNYEATGAGGVPLLNMVRGGPGGTLETVHSDLNAIVHCPRDERSQDSRNNPATHCATHAMRDALRPGGPASAEWWWGNPSHRTFTAVFHDELKTRYAPPFRVLGGEDDQKAIQAHNNNRPLGALLEGVGDGFAINYGASGMGTILLANRLGIGPARECADCFYEEFFLGSWANGDPALLTPELRAATPQAVLNRLPPGLRQEVPEQVRRGARFYPDDPANTHHSYLGDRVVFHNLHAGPKETHVFHLHAHQWRAGTDGQGAYRDSQTIAPLQAFSYEIDHGGGGNLNLTPGDSIFHCHLYPHFAQGMWGLWRNHDVLEDGTRWLPDGALGPGTDPRTGAAAGGAPVPAVVPLPGQPMPPAPVYAANPAEALPGYPFFVAGEAGHRAPQPPLDMVEDGGLPRHRIGGAGRRTAPGGAEPDPFVAIADADFRLHLEPVDLELLPADGTPLERRAMRFHAGQGTARDPMTGADAPAQATAAPLPGIGTVRFFELPLPEGAGALGRFRVNGRPPQPGAPFADPCRAEDGGPAPLRQYRVSAVELDLVVNEAGWHDPQAHINVLTDEVAGIEGRSRRAAPFYFRAHSGDCVAYHHQNRTGGELELDDFQVATPTDTIGQHIHLVKFDVLASDGAANGWNYEDGTFAALHLRERVAAANARGGAREMRPDGTPAPARRALPAPRPGAYQTTAQRWYADRTWHPDPLSEAPAGVLCDQDGLQRWFEPDGGTRTAECRDSTLRTVFTHDHFGPSSIQQHGFYSALLVEPEESVWFTADGRPMCSAVGEMPGGSAAAGCTLPVTQLAPPPGADVDIWRPNAQAVIVRAGGNGKTREAHPDFREFPMAIADFALLYTPPNDNHSPADASWVESQRQRLSPEANAALRAWRTRHGRPVDPPEAPEAISQKHHDPYLVNYAHDPVPLRIGRHSEMPRDRAPFGGIAPAIGRDGAPLPLRQDCAWTRHDARDQVDRQRPGSAGDLANAFDSLCHGDPFAEMPEAYAGEQMQIRLIQGAQEVQHVFNIPGLRWRRDEDATYGVSTGASVARAAAAAQSPGPATAEARRNLLESGFVSAQEVGISEHFEFRTRAEGGPGRLGAIDQIWHFGSNDAIWNGAWGLLRVHGGTVRDNELEWRGQNGDYTLARDGTPDATCMLRAVRNAALGRPPPACYGSDAAPPRIGDRLLSVRAARVSVAPLPGDAAIPGAGPPDPAQALARQRAGARLSQSPRVSFQGWVPREPGAPSTSDTASARREGLEAHGCPAHVAWFDPVGREWSWRPVKLRSYLVVAEAAPSGEVWSGPLGRLADPRPMRFRATHMWHSDSVPQPDGVPQLVPPQDADYEPLASGRADDHPLVLRARAGECIHVRLTHLVPPGLLAPVPGEARLPGIVSLNSTPDEEAERAPAYSFARSMLAPSRSVSLLPQLLHQTQTQAGIRAGVNRAARFPADADAFAQLAPTADGVPEVDYFWFAGRYIAAPEGLAGVPPVPEADAALSQGFVVAGFAEDFGPINLVSAADPFFHPAHGLVGTLVVHEAHADIAAADWTSPRVDVGLSGGPNDLDYGDQVIAYRDGLNHWFNGRPLPDCRVCDDSYDRGDRAAGWRAEPLWARLRVPPPFAQANGQADDPGWKDLNRVVLPPDHLATPPARTPSVLARSGQPLRLHAVQPAGRARQRVFTVLGHDYRDGRYGVTNERVEERRRQRRNRRTEAPAPPDCAAEAQDREFGAAGWYGSPGSSLLGPGRVVTALIPCPRPGFWLWRDGPAPMLNSGVWGWMEVPEGK